LAAPAPKRIQLQTPQQARQRRRPLACLPTVPWGCPLCKPAHACPKGRTSQTGRQGSPRCARRGGGYPYAGNTTTMCALLGAARSTHAMRRAHACVGIGVCLQRAARELPASAPRDAGARHAPKLRSVKRAARLSNELCKCPGRSVCWGERGFSQILARAAHALPAVPAGQGHRGCTRPHTGAPRRRIASPVYSEMDTNGDGAVTQADDPYAPYYPGRPRPVPCGRLRFS